MTHKRRGRLFILISAALLMPRVPASADAIIELQSPYVIDAMNSCADPSTLSSCSAVGTIDPAGKFELNDRIASPAGGEAPGYGWGDTIFDITTNFIHATELEAVSVQATLFFDHASVANLSRHANNQLLSGHAAITLHIEAYQQGSCCMGFHSQAVVQSPGTGHIGGAGPPGIEHSEVSINTSIATFDGSPLPPGRVFIKIQLWSRAQLSVNPVPRFGDLHAEAAGHVSSVKAKLFDVS